MKKRFGRIGVLAGGVSAEREISLKSGKAVFDALKKEGLDVVFLDIRDRTIDPIKEANIKFAFIALHGKFGEDGAVQKMLEKAGIPYTGSGPEASRLALDKIASKEMFKKCGVASPQFITIKKERQDLDALGSLKWPIVIKPQFEGSSFGLSVVREKDELKDALQKAFIYGDTLLAEEFIQGRELTVGMLNDDPLPVIEIVTRNSIYDYNAKYNDAETRYLVPAPIKRRIFEKAKRLAANAHRALRCRSFSRIDMMMDKRAELFVLEVNTIPGMTERSLLPKAAQALGIDFNKLCLAIIERTLPKRSVHGGKKKKGV